jgi:hypothetical protein
MRGGLTPLTSRPRSDLQVDRQLEARFTPTRPAQRPEERFRAGLRGGSTGPGLVFRVVGVAGFEPTASSSQTRKGIGRAGIARPGRARLVQVERPTGTTWTRRAGSGCLRCAAGSPRAEAGIPERPVSRAGSPGRRRPSPGRRPEALPAGGTIYTPIIRHGHGRLASGRPTRVRFVMSDGRSVRGHEQALEMSSRVAFMVTATRHARPQRPGLPTLRQAHQYPRQMVGRPPAAVTRHPLRLSDRQVRPGGAPAGRAGACGPEGRFKGAEKVLTQRTEAPAGIGLSDISISICPITGVLSTVHGRRAQGDA